MLGQVFGPKEVHGKLEGVVVVIDITEQAGVDHQREV
jgi:hypothetical protein